jgi:hypothetical protein
MYKILCSLRVSRKQVEVFLASASDKPNEVKLEIKTKKLKSG